PVAVSRSDNGDFGRSPAPKPPRGHRNSDAQSGGRFTDDAMVGRTSLLRPSGLLFGLRQPEQREAVYDLESARFALASQLGGDAAEVLMKPMRFNFWLASKEGPAAFTGPADPTAGRRPGDWALSTGPHCKLTPAATVGALFRARSTAGSAPGLSATTELETYGVGLYGGWAFNDHITLSALGVYDRGDNSATIDGGSGSYSSDRLSLSANLRGYWQFDNWWL